MGHEQPHVPARPRRLIVATTERGSARVRGPGAAPSDDQVRNERSPTGLVIGAQANSGVAVVVLVEQCTAVGIDGDQGDQTT